MSSVNINSTVVFAKNYQSKKRYVVNQGGSRSSKTVSLCQVLITQALQEPEPAVYSVVRKTMPSLRASAMRDFQNELEKLGLYREELHNKTNNIFQVGVVEVEFFGTDEPQKMRGRKRKRLWINEANELSAEDYFQLNIRTTHQVFMDFNPSDEYHWIYDDVMTRPDCEVITSTFEDNPFLEDALRAELLRLKDIDANKWKVYGLGQRGVKESLIHKKWKLVDAMPDSFIELVFGVDFGFTNSPTACLEIRRTRQGLFLHERIYERGLTNDQISKRLDAFVPGRAEIIADSAEPKSIEEIAQHIRPDKRGKFNIHPAEKGPDSVLHGIDVINRFELFVTKESVNLIKELQTYSWKIDRDGRITNEVVKWLDHLMNALRYAVDRKATTGAKLLWEK